MVFGGITDIAFAKQLKQDEQRNFNKKAEQNLDWINFLYIILSQIQLYLMVRKKI